MKVLFFFILFSITLTVCSQCDSANGHVPEFVLKTFPLGQSSVVLRQFLFETDSPFVLLQLHSNEGTAAAVAEKFARQEGIPFFQLTNHNERLVTFNQGGKRYQFDPNRVFSNTGIRKTLTLTSRYSEQAFHTVRRFRDSLLSFLVSQKPIVAVHNNTNENFSIRQYRLLNKNQVHINTAQDEDDFLITNDAEIFRYLKTEGYNVVLEDAAKLEEDGSLSLYCSRQQIPYVNVEAEHGHKEEQFRMLAAVLQFHKQRKNNF